MFKVFSSGFIKDPVLEMKIEEPTDEIDLFGKKYRMYKDDWKKHIHLKVTNHCDANCPFCIERPSRYDKSDCDAFMDSMRELVGQMKEQGMFRTLSVTGGEPTLFPRIQEVVDFAREVHPLLFSINSNGAKVSELRPGSVNGWLNLSKHAVDDAGVFRRNWSFGKSAMRAFKDSQPDAKLRLQCVLGVPSGLTTIDDILNFMDVYGDVADDLSFRSLIVESEHGRMNPLFEELRNFLFDEGCIVEQSIQDYYVYENYRWNGVEIVLSWSNMALLQKYNESNKGNFLEEIIVHPDGMITGSWNKKTLIIKKGGR